MYYKVIKNKDIIKKMADIDVRTINLEQAFNMFKTLDDDSEEYRNIELKVIKGIFIKFSLFDALYKRQNINLINESIGKIIINGKSFSMESFDIELMEREKLIKKFLIDKLENKQIAKIRGL